MIELNESIRKILINSKITNIKGIKDLSPPGEKMNKIFVLETTVERYLLKIFESDNALQGEESIYDSYFDLYIHRFICDKFKLWKPARNLIDYSLGDRDLEVPPYILVNYIDGNRIDVISGTVRETHIVKILNRLEQIGVGTKRDISCLGLAGIKLITNNFVGYDPTFKKYLLDETLNSMPVVKGSVLKQYFINDINTSIFEPVLRGKLIDAVAELSQDLSLKHVYLVHCDIKAANLILNRKSDSLTLIDWSRATYDDILIDIADLILMLYSLGGNKNLSTLNTLIESQDYPIVKMALDEVNSQDRLRFYLLFKLFSIGRVFYPKELPEISKKILKLKKSEIHEILATNRWVIGRKY